MGKEHMELIVGFKNCVWYHTSSTPEGISPEMYIPLLGDLNLGFTELLIKCNN
jgi:hypothetical protein